MATKITEKKASSNLWITVTVVAIVVFVLFAIVFPTDAQLFVGSIIILFTNYWWALLPLPLWYIYEMTWNEYTENEFLSKIDNVILELVPPKDIEKSPRIMEHVFAGLNDYSTPNSLELHCGWRMLQPKLTFEIVGTEGEVHFYARCPKNMRNNIEAQIYAHYPDMKIFEVDDYVRKVPKNLPNDKWDIWGATLDLVKPDPVPIRTYKHFQEDVTGKMIDPLSNMVEVMSSLPKNQHIWFQIVFISEKPPNWHPASKAYVQKIIDEHLGIGDSKKRIPFFSNLWDELKVAPNNVLKGFAGGELDAPTGAEAAETVEFNINKLPPGTQELVLAIQENLSKPAFHTVIRFVYLGTKEGYNKALGVAGIMGSMKQIADVNLNDLIPSPKTKTFANYYFDEERLLYRKRKIVADYRGQSVSGMDFIMNTEELATLYHFPDMAIRNPAVTRVESRKEDAPAELPIGVDFQESGR